MPFFFRLLKKRDEKLVPFSSLVLFPIFRSLLAFQSSHQSLILDLHAKVRDCICRSEGGAVFVVACLRRILGLKKGKKLVPVKNAAKSRSASVMSTGDCAIQITFEACIPIKGKSMEAAHSTGSGTARKIPNMFGVTLLLSKNAERVGGKSNLPR